MKSDPFYSCFGYMTPGERARYAKDIAEYVEILAAIAAEERAAVYVDPYLEATGRFLEYGRGLPL